MPEMTSETANLCTDLAKIVGDRHVLTGQDTAPWQCDWTGQFPSTPLAVVRPADTREVSQVMRYASTNHIPVVPVAGNTGLTGGSQANGKLVLSVERLSMIGEINVAARVTTMGAGVVVDAIDAAAEAHGLTFPLTFGASGSARLGGVLSTNAGGANVLRYGTARELCLGVEVVLPNGDVIDLLSPLRKNNTGFDLRNLLIGAEGQLGIITTATVKLFPRPSHHFTALVAMDDLARTSALLNAFQDASNGQLVAFEYMSSGYFDLLRAKHPGKFPGFAATPANGMLIEVSAQHQLMEPSLMQVLEEALENSWISDALVAQNEGHRQEMWHMREISAEMIFAHPHAIDTDIAVPLDLIDSYLNQVRAKLKMIDPECREMTVGHMGDGNLHVAVHPSTNDPEKMAALRDAIESQAVSMGGTFSAEHGIGLCKLTAMAQHKDATQLGLMREIKAVFDPKGLMNSGKYLPNPV